MSDNSKPTQNGSLSFELTDWLGKAERLDRGAFGGPWAWGLDSADRIIMTTHGAVPFTLIEGDDFRGATEEAEWIAWSRTALPAAVAALRAVLDLHVNDTEYGSPSGPMCEECNRANSEGLTYIEWPCPTIQAIQDTLGEE